MTEQPLEFLSLKEATQAHLSLRTLVNMPHSQATLLEIICHGSNAF